MAAPSVRARVERRLEPFGVPALLAEIKLHVLSEEKDEGGGINNNEDGRNSFSATARHVAAGAV